MLANLTIPIIIITCLKGYSLYINPSFSKDRISGEGTLSEVPHTKKLLAKVNKNAEETSGHRQNTVQ